MLCNFQRTFRPTEEQKKEMADQMKRIRAQLVRERHCAVCLYCYKDLEQLPTGEFDITERCSLGRDHERIMNGTCDNWEERDADWE